MKPRNPGQVVGVALGVGAVGVGAEVGAMLCVGKVFVGLTDGEILVGVTVGVGVVTTVGLTVVVLARAFGSQAQTDTQSIWTLPVAVGLG